MRGKIFFSRHQSAGSAFVLAMLCKSSFCAKVNPPPYHFRGQKTSRRRQARCGRFLPLRLSRVRRRTKATNPKGNIASHTLRRFFPPPQQQYHLFCLCKFRLGDDDDYDGDDDDDVRQSHQERDRLRITQSSKTQGCCFVGSMLSLSLSYLFFFFNCFLFFFFSNLLFF